MSKYITTPIYYINDVPHIGHAYTSVAADVLSRYWKTKGEDVFLLTGTDEHGAKIAEAAEKAGRTPKEFIDDLVPRFKNTWKKLNIDYNQFIRTTDPKHEKIVQEFITEIKDAGFIEKRKYEGLYCVGCERFLTEDELVEGKCPDHKTVPAKQSEENYFFLLSKVAEKYDLLKKIELDDIKISPEGRKNEVLGKIKAGLEDVSISREKVEWGVKIPWDESQTVYVWFDALINYYTATKIYDKAARWPADLHLIGKDILWFHAVIWPAMLLATGKKLPKEVFAHGFFTINGEKMSKTIGNVMDPNALVDKFGADAVRYALLREFPFGQDGDISEEKILQRYNSELASGLGNLVSRVISMINKYEIKLDQSSDMTATILDFSDRMENLEFDTALIEINEIISATDRVIEENKPWELAKAGNTQKLTVVLSGLHSRLSSIIGYIEPFMPETAEKMEKQLKTLKPEPLFPRLEK